MISSYQAMYPGYYLTSFVSPLKTFQKQISMSRNTTHNVLRMISVLFCMSLAYGTQAQQDTLFKTNGEKIACKVLEVGTTGISYKKADNPDGPTFVDNRDDILFIRYKNGQKQEFLKTTLNGNAPANNNLTNGSNNDPGNNNNNGNGSNKSDKARKGPISDEYKIIFDGKKYYVNNQKIGRRDVDRLLSRSDNPAVKVPYKTAKLTKTFQKIIGITSYPSTVSGGITSFATFRTVYIEAQNGGAQPSSWINAGLSFLGTLSLPITSKILKNRRDKLYDKVIDIYNVGKK